eukprot:TRINITY_DN50148_c0_g1_i1.p1 TRINITY_DN50148_c0_g1~~TRINITY_DN50148_c0_g1_i1.p1  ORF type:complete len:509 (-),score=84.31 TRINITY_DN50148_c0_g1_i1:459-1985(-)
MGACKRNKKSTPSVAYGGGAANDRAAENARLPGPEQVQDLWMSAVQNEDAEAACACARLCDTLGGAERFANTDGLDAFIAVANGQSMKDGQSGNGLMQALAQALMHDMTPFKTSIFETLAACAQWPSLKGRVAGSGVLGVVAATLLAPRHGPESRSLMARLAGLLTVDAPEVKRLGDERREEEFRKLRKQLISGGCLKAFATMVRKGSHTLNAVAGAGAIASLAGFGGDAEAKKGLLEADVVGALLSRLPDFVPPVVEKAVPAAGSGDNAGVGGSEGTASGEVPAAAAATSANTSTAAASVAEESSDDEGSRIDLSLEAALRALSAVAAASGPGAIELQVPLGSPEAVQALRKLLSAESSAVTNAGSEALRCLVQLASRETGPAVWPPQEIDESLTADIVRLLVLSNRREELLKTLVQLFSERGVVARVGDVRPLRRALDSKAPKNTPEGKARSALENLTGCDACGRVPATASTLMVCTGCRKVEYCSRECQKAAWKTHKPMCGNAKK